MFEPRKFQEDLKQIEQLIHELEVVADPGVRARTVELVRLVMEMHSVGIGRMLEIISRTGAAGDDILDRFTRDEMASGMLLLHDLHPVDLPTRVKQALDKVRPMLKSHGGDVELLSLEDGMLQLRLQGSCHGCPSSAMTLKNAIEAALYEAAPDLDGLEVLGVVTEGLQASGFIPLEIVEYQR
jgi:Fe-S cluster biogenesis protein NfuA